MINKGEILETKKIIVNGNEKGTRIDKFLNEKIADLSRARVQKIIEEGNVFVNESVAKASYKVNTNDCIIVKIEEAKEIDLEAQDIPLDIIFENNDYLIINKQKGLVVHPGNGNLDGTLVNAIMAHCKDSLSGIGGEIRPGIVHRIDKDTSGVIIVAKNDKAHINISEQIKNHEVKKTYVALVRGVIKENEATINMPIGRSKNDRIKMAVDRDGKEAITHFKVLKRFDKYTYLEVNIETGRTHQIRVHLSHIGFPIVGDDVYSNGKNPFGVQGQMLHAQKIEFTSPTTGEKVEYEAKKPEYFEEVLKKLENGEF